MRGGEGDWGDKRKVLDEKFLLARIAKAPNLGRGWNLTGDGQAGLGHPPWQAGFGGARHERTRGKGGWRVLNALSLDILGKFQETCYHKFYVGPTEHRRLPVQHLEGIQFLHDPKL